jgi:homoserine dehydrogenase
MSTSHARPLTIGLIGWGTVGSALGRLLTEGPLALELVRLAVRDPHRHRSSPLPDVSLGTPEEIAAAGDCQVVVELAGGADVALPWAERALSRGAAYVTANKALLATHGGALANLAREKGGALLASASVGGGAPMIEVVEHLAATGQVVRLRGLLNATTTFICSEMAAGRSYPDALAEAQRAGYAEADPSFDVEGRDAAQKLAILASVAWGRWRSEREVDTRGIVGITVPPGRVVRLLAEADGTELRVGPMELPAGSPLALASGVESVLEIEVRGAGTFRVAGPGAGGRATAGAVYGDLRRLLAGERPTLFGGAR